MIIDDLKIDGFGVWRRLHVDHLDGRLNVFYGPNEAGKTTLLEFVRAILYGFSPARRSRYLPPLHGGTGGGSLVLATDNGPCEVARHDSGDGPDGHLRISDDAGVACSPSALGELLRNLPEPVFNHVFALGIEELQELGTLSHAEVAARLYHLSTGLRGMTLAQVLHELQESRQRLLAADDQSGQLWQLLNDREVLRAELRELRKLTRQYADVLAERDSVDRTIAELESRRAELAAETRLVELAIRIRPLWLRRDELDCALAGRTAYIGVGSDVVTRFDANKQRLRQRKQELEELEPEVERLRATLAMVQVNDALWRQGQRIEMLCDQQEWITSLESQLGAAELEASDLEAQQKRLAQQIGWQPDEDTALFSGSRKSVAIMRPVARAQRQASEDRKKSQELARHHREAGAALERQIAAALAGRTETELAAALEACGDRVNQLRRRVQLDERLDQSQRSRKELEADNHQLRSQDVLSPRTLLVLGCVFAVGITLLLAGLLLPSSWTGGRGLALAFVGLCSGVGAVVTKLWLQRAYQRELETCSQQLTMVKREIETAIRERDELDQRLPNGGGPLLTRLQSAERELASLEELLPLEAQRQTCQREAETAERAAQQAEADLAAARRRWQELLVELGLPASLRPRQLRALTSDLAQWKEVARRLAARRQEITDRRRVLETLVLRIEEAFEAAQLEPASGHTVERLRQLRQSLADQEVVVARRSELRKSLRKLRRRAERARRLVAEFKLRRRTILQLAGVDNEADFRARAAEQAETLRLQRELAEVRADMAAALADQADEENVRPLLVAPAVAALEQRRERLAGELHEVESSIRQKFENRGQLNEQLKHLAADRRPSEKRLEFDLLNERLAETIHRWQVLALTHRLLDAIREVYQRERQPATLKAASHYFQRMTCGRYVRVWTPLSEDTLMVDDADGNELPIAVLSRGTREQLFLSLRLALAADFATRGQRCPLVLDDLLVNFDTERARATAEVLQEFAAGGHQVLLFTCHDHIKRLFQELGVRVRRLPDNSESPATATDEELHSVPPGHVPLVPPAVPVAPGVELSAIAGEACAFKGWPVADDFEEDLVTVEDLSPFWTLVARARPWKANGAEEFAGEFAERVVDEVRQPGVKPPAGMPGKTRPPSTGRNRPAARPKDSRSRGSQQTTPETPLEGAGGGATHEVWLDKNDHEAA